MAPRLGDIDHRILCLGSGGGQTRHVSYDEPPEQIGYDLDEALALLGALEDARDALIDSGHLTVVVAIETEIRTLSHMLGFDDPRTRRRWTLNHFGRPRQLADSACRRAS